MNPTPLVPDPASLSQDQAILMAKLAEQAERYEDMTAYMMQGVKDKTGDDITIEERNLISVGYKNLMSARRIAHRITKQQIDEDMIQVEENLKSAATAKANEYKDKISGELKVLIDKVVDEVVKKFTSGPLKATDSEVLVFFKKMEGDYNRYGAEVTEGSDRESFTSRADAAYKEATEMCFTWDRGTALATHQSNPSRSCSELFGVHVRDLRETGRGKQYGQGRIRHGYPKTR